MSTFGKNFVGFVGTTLAFAVMMWCMDLEPAVGRVTMMIVFGATIAAYGLGITMLFKKTAASILSFSAANAVALVGTITFIIGMTNPSSLLHGDFLALLYTAGCGALAGFIGSLTALAVSLVCDLKAGRTTWQKLLVKVNRFADRVANKLPARENAVGFIAGVAGFVVLIVVANLIGGREPEAYLHDIIFVSIVGCMVVGSGLTFMHFMGRTAKDWRMLTAFTAGVPALAFFCEIVFLLSAPVLNALFAALLIGAFCALPGIVGSLAARLVSSSAEPAIDGIVA